MWMPLSESVRSSVRPTAQRESKQAAKECARSVSSAFSEDQRRDQPAHRPRLDRLGEVRVESRGERGVAIGGPAADRDRTDDAAVLGLDRAEPAEQLDAALTGQGDLDD